jgi:hypothetical protein
MFRACALQHGGS